MKTTPQTPNFAYCSDKPADLLHNAASVVRYLAETAGSVRESMDSTGLSELGSNGLALILHGVENTLNLAEQQL